MKRTILLFAVAAAFIASTRGDESTSEDKSRYTLFNPTPADCMRAWRTDRAGVTPYTVDAGHFEADIVAVGYSYDQRDEKVSGLGLAPFFILKLKSEEWRYGATVIKVGLANRLDAELRLLPFETITVGPRDNGILYQSGGTKVFVARRTVSGFGEMTSRLKFNLVGDDEGKIALSVSGNVKYPTANHELGNGQFEGGPSLEFAAQLPWGFELRIDESVNLFEDNEHARQASFESLISLSHQIVGALEGYFMFNTVAYTTAADWLGEVKMGLNYRVTRNLELYAGTYIGVTDRAWDYQPFLGVTARF